MKPEIKSLLLGTTFYGTGGGGDPRLAKTIYTNLVRANAMPVVTSLKECAKNSIFITCFTVGGLEQTQIPDKSIHAAMQVFSQEYGQPVCAVIPVEIGPLSVALAFQLASYLKLPVLDADIVGGRSTPEVFLETITLFAIPRTPLVVINSQGSMAVLKQAVNERFEEQFLRSFAEMSGGFALVLGYPLSYEQIETSVTQGTISQALLVGELLLKKIIYTNLDRIGGKILSQGIISDITSYKNAGFTGKSLLIQNKNDIYEIFIKNETIILKKNGKPVLTCPDLIILLKGNTPLYNGALKKGLEVTIIGCKAVPLWRSKKGRELFHPKLFGIRVKQQLLSL